MVRIRLNFSMQIESGPSISILGPQNYQVPAYDKISVAVPNDSTEKIVSVQPSGVGQVEFIIIQSSKYDDPKEAQPKLSYKIVGDATNKTIKLDQAQFLVGKSLVGLLPTAPQQLAFMNSLDSEAVIDIITGRNA